MALARRIGRYLKKNLTVYGAAKIVRDFRHFPFYRRHGLRALPLISRVYSKTMLPPPRLYNFIDAVDSVNAEGIPGDLVECGVWSGGALALAALWDQRRPGSNRSYLGFDSFEGLPPPTPEDKDVFDRFTAASARKGRMIDRPLMRTGVCVGDAADTVRQFFRDAGVDPSRTRFYPGWFQDTLPIAVADIDAIAILRIDGDWYDSTKICLDTFYDLVPPGGYIIIDDYGCFEGCKDAVEEFRAARSITTPITFVDQHCVYWRR
jgi:hypothetical protein